MNNMNKDIFLNVCSFLKLTELHRVRTLSKIHYEWVTLYLIRVFKKTCIESFACPICANFIDQRDISKLHYFYDLYINERENDEGNERFRYINRFFLNNKRRFLLCEDCETCEIYDNNYHNSFKFKGKRVYEVFTIHIMRNFPWSILYMKDENGLYNWNEYRLVTNSLRDSDDEEGWY